MRGCAGRVRGVCRGRVRRVCGACAARVWGVCGACAARVRRVCGEVGSTAIGHADAAEAVPTARTFGHEPVEWARPLLGEGLLAALAAQHELLALLLLERQLRQGIDHLVGASHGA